MKERETVILDNVYGYIYDAKGMHGGAFRFKGTNKNIANFIMQYSENRVVITDSDDLLVASASSTILNQVCDHEVRKSILEFLLPMQLTEMNLSEIEFSVVGINPLDKEIDYEVMK